LYAPFSPPVYDPIPSKRNRYLHIHTQIRTHPITGLNSLFYNPLFLIHIAELKAQESLHVLSFLREHLHAADDLSVRWKWEPGSVAMWDNRVVAHRALPGGYDTDLREGKRTAVFGERPVFRPDGKTLSQRKQQLESADKGEAKLRFIGVP
jgi:sulfonate dioxygenase